ncbi:MAG TPA: hypothetical protein ENL06_02170 [Candidatus Portnoybacteria bacterium]|nr:hypothetical protein [Candidatus Portnoybacteria bacterium]
MDKIEKALKKLNKKEKQKIKGILNQISDSNFRNLDFKKLKGRNDIYRVRKGDIRIIFRKAKNNSIKILAIERRNSQTYKKVR